MPSAIDRLLNPRSVAVIGASANPVKLSHIAMKNLSSGSFSLIPVNPHEAKILGRRCYRSILDVPGEVDLVLISLPAEPAVNAVRECADKGVSVAVVTASGFSESGPVGRKLEEDLLGAVKGSRTRVLGPNTMGVFVPSRRLDTFFIPRDRSPRPPPGSIAMLSQSGAVSVSFLERAAASGMGIYAAVGLGNKADLNENDFLGHLGREPAVRSIAVYLESFSDGREFAGVARAVTRRKPVAMLKSGRTRSGASAAKSHTGAIAGSSDAVVGAVLRQVGIVRVYDEEELGDVAKALAYIDHIGDNRICVVASAGGYGVIGADLVESSEKGAGMRMAALSQATAARIRKLVPGYSSVSNPVDLTAAVSDEMYDKVLEAIQGDKGVDGVMMSLELQPPNVTDALVDVAGRRANSRGARVIVSVFGGERTQDVIREFESKGVPAYPTIWRCIRAFRALAERGRYLSKRKTLSEDAR